MSEETTATEATTLSDAQIDAIVAERNRGEPWADPPEAGEGDSTEAQEATEDAPEAKTEPQEPAKPPKAEEEPPAPQESQEQTARAREFAILAKHAKTLREQERLLKEREAELEAKISQIQPPKKWEDPIALLEAHGYSVEDAARLYVTRSGAKLPPEQEAAAKESASNRAMREAMEQIQALQARIDESERKRAEYDQQREHAAANERLILAGRNAAGFVAANSAQFPILASFGQDEVADIMLSLRAESLANGQQLSIQEAASVLENEYRARLLPLVSKLQPAATQTQQQATNPPAKSQQTETESETLTNNDSAKRPKRKFSSIEEELKAERDEALKAFGGSLWVNND